MQRDAPHAQQLEAGQRNRETDTGGMARFTVVPLPCARFVAIRVPGRGVDTSHGVQSRFFLRPSIMLKNVAHFCTNRVKTVPIRRQAKYSPHRAAPSPASLQDSTGMSIACQKLRIKRANKGASHENHVLSDANEFAVVVEPLAGAAG
jgi:hypothetical protein